MKKITLFVIGALLLAMAACGYEKRDIDPRASTNTHFIFDVISAAEGDRYWDDIKIAGSTLTLWANSSSTPETLFSLNLPGFHASQARRISLVLTQVTPHFPVRGVNEATFKLYIQIDQGQPQVFQQSGQARWSRRGLSLDMHNITGHSLTLVTTDRDPHYQQALGTAVRFIILNPAGQKIGHISSLARYRSE